MTDLFADYQKRMDTQLEQEIVHVLKGAGKTRKVPDSYDAYFDKVNAQLQKKWLLG